MGIGDFLSSAGGGSAIGGVTSLIGSLIGNRQYSKNLDKMLAAQKEENEAARVYNYNLAKQQNTWNIEQWNRENKAKIDFWNMQNEYNSPEGLAKRGLNPDLAYGGSFAAGQLTPASSPSMTSGAPASPVDMSPLQNKPTLGQAFQQAMNDAMQVAQISSVEASRKNTSADTKQKEANTVHIKNLNDLTSLQKDDLKKTLILRDNEIRLSDQSLQMGEKNLQMLDKQLSQADVTLQESKQRIENLISQKRNVDMDTWSKQVHTFIDSDIAKAQIKKLASATARDYKEMELAVKNYLLDVETTASNLKLNSAKYYTELWNTLAAEQNVYKLQTENDRLVFDLSQDQTYEDTERTLGNIQTVVSIFNDLINAIK